jgi:K+-sensing histidine kinase KdpD
MNAPQDAIALGRWPAATAVPPLARMSHDLKSPLGALLLMTEMMQADGDARLLGAAQRHRLARIHAAGREVLATVTELLGGKTFG